MSNPEVLIAIAVIVGLLVFLGAAFWKLGTLAQADTGARVTFLKLMDPAVLASLLMLLGVLFLLGMAILDLDKGRVLAGMGKAPFARGLITYLFAIVTIGTAVALVLSALLGAEPRRFQDGKEILGLLLGVFGTIVGFYFASELSQAEVQGQLSVSSILVRETEVPPDGTAHVSAVVRGGNPPYRFGLALAEEPPKEYEELAKSDGWIVYDVTIPASAVPRVHTLTLGVQDAAGERVSARTYLKIAQPSAK